jgi:flagellar biosynthesis protein FlhF
MTATIRTFRAPGAKEALEAIKEALGPEAVIIGTREVKGGFFRKSEVEVTAALPHTTAKPEAYRPPPSPAPAPAPGRSHDAPPGLRPSQSLKDELAKLREEMTSLRKSVTAPVPQQPHAPPAADALKRHLLNRGMEDDLATDVVTQAVERSAVNGSVSALMSALRDVLNERVLAGRAPWLSDRRRVIGLIGPTGAGKTTTLAKIAAHALQSQQKVALITVDTFRVGATEQLGHYGNIMKIPSFVARSRPELEKVVAQCSRADLVLIDTAGCSKPDALGKQAELVRSVAGAQLNLVVSVASGARDLAAIIERHRHLAPERLILTKLDEAASPASFLSASLRLSRPIVALCDGQRVPEDIHAVTGPDLVGMVFGP